MSEILMSGQRGEVEKSKGCAEALLLAGEIENDQGDTGHAKDEEAKHDEHSEILSLGDEAIGIGFAGGAGENGHDQMMI